MKTPYYIGVKMYNMMMRTRLAQLKAKRLEKQAEEITRYFPVGCVNGQDKEDKTKVDKEK